MMIHEKYILDCKELGLTPATKAILKAKEKRENTRDSMDVFYDAIIKPRTGYAPEDYRSK